MNGARDQFLADTRFALDQHRNRGRCSLLAHRDDVIHRLGTGDDVGESELAFAAMPDALKFAFQRAGIERIAQGHLQAFDADRLHHEIVRPGPHCGHHIVDTAVGGLYDHRQIEADIANLGQHTHAVEAGHDEIEHQRIDGLRIGIDQMGEGGIAAVHCHGVVTAALHHVLDEATLYGIVVGNQDSRNHGIPRNSGLSQQHVSNRGTLAEAD